MEVVVDWHQEVADMADAETLPPAVLNAIASKLGDRIPRAISPPALGLVGGAPPPAPTLKETFPVWTLEAADILAPTNDLGRLAKNTAHWHHQISTVVGPVAYARSMPLGAAPESWSIRQVSTSELASKIDDTIGWIDANIPDPLTARLLSVPAYHVYAFWLVDATVPANQKVVVITAPPQSQALTENKVYTSQEFLEALRATPHIKGLSG
jgi:hypothetical protein